MEEELQDILSNEELDENGRVEAIKTLVGNGFIPRTKYSELSKKVENVELEKKNVMSEFEQFKKEKMTEEEKIAEQKQKELEENEKVKLSLSQMTAENIFAKAGFKEEDYQDLLKNIVGTDIEKTKSLAETFCNTLVKQKETVEKGIREAIIKGAKKPSAGNYNQEDEADSDIDKYKKGLTEAQKKNDDIAIAYYTRLIQESQRNEE